MAEAGNPVVAFGLAALEAAMKAKAGRLRRGEAGGLLDQAKALLPDDVAAQGMALRFAQMADGDAARAGLILHDALTGWRDGMPLRRVHQGGPVRFGWQDRADLNG